MYSGKDTSTNRKKCDNYKEWSGFSPSWLPPWNQEELSDLVRSCQQIHTSSETLYWMHTTDWCSPSNSRNWQPCQKQGNPGKHHTMWKNNERWLLIPQSPGSQVHIAVKSWSRSRSESLGSTCAATAVLADNWFGQSIWYDNFCRTNIIDDMIW